MINAASARIDEAQSTEGGGYELAGEIVFELATIVVTATKVSKVSKLRKGREIIPGPDEGVIYRINDANKTPSGQPYVGSANDLGKRNRGAKDGRDRTGAEIIDTYPKGNRAARRAAEQRGINRSGGKDRLDNKRDEIRRSKWRRNKIDPPEEG